MGGRYCAHLPRPLFPGTYVLGLLPDTRARCAATARKSSWCTLTPRACKAPSAGGSALCTSHAAVCSHFGRLAAQHEHSARVTSGAEVRGVVHTGWIQNACRRRYESGTRVPSFVLWGGGTPKPSIAAKTVDHTPISACDWLPTVAAIAGVALPDGIHLDGEDMSHVFLDQRTGPCLLVQSDPMHARGVCHYTAARGSVM